MTSSDDAAALDALREQSIEIPSWGFGPSGTRFATHQVPGQARTLEERVADAELVARYTGARLRLSLHMPWDVPESGWTALGARLRAGGIEPGTVNPNLFGEGEFRLGSIANPDAAIRRRATEHLLESVEAAKQLGVGDMWVWVPDGTNYPGQGHFRERRRWVRDALGEVYAALDPDQRLLIEYKLFEPAVYHMDVADWGQALLLCQQIGERAQVAVDIGHHAHGVNIEHVAATLLEEGRLGSFDLNDRKYADDDLMVGSINPFALFLVFAEVADAMLDTGAPEIAAAAARVLHKIDIAFPIEDKIAAMIQSVVATQTAWAKVFMIDRDALAAARAAGDVVGAHVIMQDAFETDVRGLLAEFRRERGGAERPVADYRGGDDRAARRKER
ncbi:MAG: L-rhamnose isomerase / sugar isomerase [Thermoleophilaceae bacterium]|nr:L-rhamnose isomerase / sugar isomerase [Thermoleophilaceae bacterium]MEA2455986.1 L-rhamnose isomerase / sugar isomerase [Thermoleophilaceae bacterium]